MAALCVARRIGHAPAGGAGNREACKFVVGMMFRADCRHSDIGPKRRSGKRSLSTHGAGWEAVEFISGRCAHPPIGDFGGGVSPRKLEARAQHPGGSAAAERVSDY